MNTKQKVDTLWRELREAINKAYASSDAMERGQTQDDLCCLRDYAENISWSDNLAGLLGRESANERQHRANRPSVPGFSVETAAKLILMGNILDGALKPEMPSATLFLVLRKTAAEALVLGYIVREHLPAQWREAIESLDYSNLMNGHSPA